MALAIGSLAPSVSLKHKTSAGLQDLRLGDHFGKEPFVLLFFPLAFTGVCTEEMCAVTEDLSSYTGLGVKVYAVSVDSPFAQEAWVEKNKIKISVLSDFNREAIKAYDVLCPSLVGLEAVAKRSAFIINKEGVVIYSWCSEDPKQLPPFAEIKKALIGL